MAKRKLRKACRKCKTIIIKGGECPMCGATDLSTKWYGCLYVINPDKSRIANELGIKKKGVYAILIF